MWVLAGGTALAVIVLPSLFLVGLDHLLPAWATWLLVGACVAPIVTVVLILEAGRRSGGP
jgi:hypothetical protein